MQKNRTATAMNEPAQPPSPPESSADAPGAERLRRLEHMFSPFMDDELMQGLRRLAVKCAREGLIRG